MKNILLGMIRCYQQSCWFSRPWLKTLWLSDAPCRFRPTCSQYCYQAIEKYGTLKGVFLGLKRIVRCHPWAKGGEDPVR